MKSYGVGVEGLVPRRRRQGRASLVMVLLAGFASCVPGAGAQSVSPGTTSPGGGWTLTLALARQGIQDEIASRMRYSGSGTLF